MFVLRLWLCHALLAQDTNVPSVFHLRCNTGSLRQPSKLVQLWLFETFATEYIHLDPPRQILGGLVLHVSAGGYGEDVIEFFKCSLLPVKLVSVLSRVNNGFHRLTFLASTRS